MTHEQLEAIRKNAEEASGLPFTAFSISQAVEKDIPALLAEVERLKAQLEDATSICLWSARRLSSVYKPYVYDYIDDLTNEKSERL